MATKLNNTGVNYAKELIKQGKVVVDEKDAWNQDKPSTAEENEFIRLHGYDEYAKWYLGIDENEAKDTKARYKFPFGDFQKVHRCGVISAESRAGQYKHFDIEKAARQLLEMIDKTKRS